MSRVGTEIESPVPSGRDPRRSLLIGSVIAGIVLSVLAGLVAIGIYLVFSVRP